MNQGSAPVDLIVAVQGYLADPSASAAGSTYFDVPELHIADTQNGLGGVGSTPVPPNGSITFTVTGVDGVATRGVSAVAESVRGTDATATGFLSVYAAGSPNPNQPGVNFYAGANQGNGLTTSLVSANVSSAGQQTITNHSTGTVDVIASVRGYYAGAIVPAAPRDVSVTVSGSAATVSWSPNSSDGGAPITGDTVTAFPDNATVTVGGSTYSATLTGLASAATDSFSVTAANSVGAGDAASYGPSNGIAGTMVTPSGQPVAGATVDLYTSDPPSADALDYPPVLVGSVTTDANGRWSFAVPPYASLPAAAQAVADNNGGILNLEAQADGYATTTSATTRPTTSYDEVAFGGGSAWVGTSSQASAPPGVVATGNTVATFRPIDVTDTSSRLTATNEANTWASLNDPLATDTSGAWNGDPSISYADPVSDAYGFQEVGGNGTYNPNLTSDGTNLTNVAVTPDGGGGGRCINTDDDGDWDVKLDRNGNPIKGWSWMTVGEQHAYWDANGWQTYTKTAQTTYSVMESVDGGDVGFSYNASFTSGVTWSTGITRGPKASYLNVLATNWQEVTETLKCAHGTTPHTYVKIIRNGIQKSLKTRIGTHTYSGRASCTKTDRRNGRMPVTAASSYRASNGAWARTRESTTSTGPSSPS